LPSTLVLVLVLLVLVLVLVLVVLVLVLVLVLLVLLVLLIWRLCVSIHTTPPREIHRDRGHGQVHGNRPSRLMHGNSSTGLRLIVPTTAAATATANATITAAAHATTATAAAAVDAAAAAATCRHNLRYLQCPTPRTPGTARITQRDAHNHTADGSWPDIAHCLPDVIFPHVA
jgi:hypothetical protein